MTVKYEYKCDNCGKDYAEQRGATEPQFFVDCEVCKEGKFVEVAQTKISDSIEVVTVTVEESISQVEEV